jgi:hypothetical protein
MTPDSGTSAITFPSWAYEKAQNAGYLKTVKRCNSVDNLGELTFKINGQLYPIPSRHFYEVSFLDPPPYHNLL